MSHHEIVAWATPKSSDAITNVLGVLALLALFITALYTAGIYLKESRRRAARHNRYELERKRASQPKTLMEFDDGYSDELKRIEATLTAYYESTLLQARRKLVELVERAETGLQKLAESYGRRSMCIEGDTRKSRAGKYKAVCERQWAYFKSELSYLSYHDVQDQLRHILDGYRALESHASRRDEQAPEEAPETLRSQEIVSLVRAVTRDQVGHLQHDMLEAIEPFSDYYERHVKEWLNDRLFRVVGKIREKGAKGITIADTRFKDQFNSLKTRLEVIARLSERISQNTQEMSQDGLALCQIVYVGTALSILSEANDWFPELAADEGAVAGRIERDAVPTGR